MANSSSSSSTTPLEPEKECHYLYGFVWKNNYLTDQTYRILVAIISMNSMTVLPTILLNVLTILALTTKERLQSTSHVLLASLAGIDLFGVVTAQSIGIAIETKRILGEGPFCDLQKAFTVICIGGGFAVVGQIVLISIDRYIAIKHPLRYREMVSRRRVKYALFFEFVCCSCRDNSRNCIGCDRQWIEAICHLHYGKGLNTSCYLFDIRSDDLLHLSIYFLRDKETDETA